MHDGNDSWHETWNLGNRDEHMGIRANKWCEHVGMSVDKAMIMTCTRMCVNEYAQHRERSRTKMCHISLHDHIKRFFQNRCNIKWELRKEYKFHHYNRISCRNVSWLKCFWKPEFCFPESLLDHIPSMIHRHPMRNLVKLHLLWLIRSSLILWVYKDWA